jgi:hypothetical protein
MVGVVDQRMVGVVDQRVVDNSSGVLPIQLRQSLIYFAFFESVHRILDAYLIVVMCDVFFSKAAVTHSSFTNGNLYFDYTFSHFEMKKGVKSS